MVVIIPAAGKGQRFVSEGYERPKPYLYLDRQMTMLGTVIDMINPDVEVLIPSLEGHIRDYYLYRRNVARIGLRHTPAGAALSVLACDCYIKHDYEEVLIINSDNVLKIDPFSMVSRARTVGADGAIMVFEPAEEVPLGGVGPWSYVEISKENAGVIRVSEKVKIGPQATAGVYYFRTWSLARAAICAMVAANVRTNGEYYVAPAYMNLVDHRNFIMPYKIQQNDFISLGTPQDFEENRHAALSEGFKAT